MADDQAPHDWQLLSCICNSLRRPDQPLYQALCHDYYPREYLYLAIESALRTGGVPIRGQRVTAFDLGPPERIEGKLDAEAAIDIPLDEITLRLVATDFTTAPRRPIRRPRIWKPSKEWVKREIELFGSVLAERKLRAERQFIGLSMIAPSAAGAPRAKKRDHSPPCLEFAKFKRVEADAEALEKALTPREPVAIGENALPAVAAPDVSCKPLLDAPLVGKSPEDILNGLIDLKIRPGRHRGWPWKRVQSEMVKAVGDNLKGLSLRSVQRKYQKLVAARHPGKVRR